jgi:hypothetical protein
MAGLVEATYRVLPFSGAADHAFRVSVFAWSKIDVSGRSPHWAARCDRRRR